MAVSRSSNSFSSINANSLSLNDDMGNTYWSMDGTTGNNSYSENSTNTSFVMDTTTTDNTPTTLAAVSTSTDNSYQISATVVGIKNDGTQMGCYKIEGSFKNSGGTVSQTGSTTQLHTATDDSNWNVAFSIMGTTIMIEVTGVSSTTINWSGSIESLSIQN